MAREKIEDYYRYGKQIDADKRAPTACLTRRAEEWSNFGPRTEVVVCSRMPGGSDTLEFTNTGYVLIDGEPKARTTVTREELAKNGIEVPYPVIDHTKK